MQDNIMYLTCATVPHGTQTAHQRKRNFKGKKTFSVDKNCKIKSGKNRI